MDNQDIFYYAKSDGIPCYYQPETGETVPRNKFCGLLMDIQNWFWDIFGTPDCKVYLRKRNKRIQYETESATFQTEFSKNGQESYIEIVY